MEIKILGGGGCPTARRILYQVPAGIHMHKRASPVSTGACSLPVGLILLHGKKVWQSPLEVKMQRYRRMLWVCNYSDITIYTNTLHLVHLTTIQYG